MSSPQVTISSTEYPFGTVTNTSAMIDGGEHFVSLIDGKDGRGLLLRFYHPETGTQDVARLTKEDAAELRRFLYKFETGL